MITGTQVRAARALLKWAQWRLAKAANMSLRVLAKIEGSDHSPDASEVRLATIRAALEAAGVEFIPENGGGAGVRLKKWDETT